MREHEYPAGYDENRAMELVKQWVGPAGNVRAAGEANGPDFWIEYNDGRRGAVEVKSAVSPVIGGASRTLPNPHRHEEIPLPEGSGLWSLRLASGVETEPSEEEITSFIFELISAEIRELYLENKSPRTIFEARAMDLGLRHIYLLDPVKRDSAMVAHVSGKEGMLANSELINTWIDGYFNSDFSHRGTSSLAHIDADEKHLFLVASPKIRFGYGHFSIELPTELPTSHPNVPEHISHLWVHGPSSSPEGVGRSAALYERSQGWSSVSLSGS